MRFKTIILTLLGVSAAGSVVAQNALDAYNVSQWDLKGTARYMGMAGAFGALGGDLSAITQNPGGIGVYRSSDIGFTLALDVQSSTAQDQGMNYKMDQTKFYLNNIGAVLTLRLPNKTCPNLNFGFVYNKGASFNRVFGGNINTLHNSMSNYIAGIANGLELTDGDVSYDNGNDPYNAPAGYVQAPWLTVLGYNSYLINGAYNPTTEETHWTGIWDNPMNGQNTNGNGRFMMRESGCQNDFNIVFGGNINNVLYWGMNFDVVNLRYDLDYMWGESLNNAIVPAPGGGLQRGGADWNLNSFYSLRGTGFNYQLGFILKPVQALRLGFAFHTPTWYNINEEYYAYTNFNLGDKNGVESVNDNIPGYTSYNFRTPWKIMASAAGVIGNNLIVSFDYEWANYGKMRFSEPAYNSGYDWYDPWYPFPYSATGVNSRFYQNPYEFENGDISTYYKSTNTFRVGAEFKPIQSLSIRAGYSYVSSPVQSAAKNNEEIIYTSSLIPGYRFDNSTNYITCGLGYRYSHFYADIAYVYKHMTSEFHAYSPDPVPNSLPSPQSNISLNNSQIVLSMGYRF